MRVLFVNTRYPPEGRAGPAFSVQHLAEQLAREGGTAIVFCRSDRSGVSREIRNGVVVVRAGTELATEQLLAVWGQVLDRNRPDIVHTNLMLQMPPTLLGRLVKQRGIPLVHTLRELSLLCPNERMRDGRICVTQCPECREATAPRREFAESLDGVIGISRYILEAHQREGMFRATAFQKIIHSSYAPPTRLATASAVGSPPRIGYLGRIDPTKGVELLLEALTTRLSSQPWTLTLAGHGTAAGRGASDYAARLKERYRDLRIRFLGFAPPAALLSQIDLLVVPSLLEEAFPRATIEAYAHGVAVVGARRGGIPEGIDDGRTGMLFDPDAKDGPTSLGTTLGGLLADRELVASMKSEALTKWGREFTPEKILGDYSEFYKVIVSA